MARLGYNKYAAQGGDWGSMVTSAIGMQDTEHCIGIHLNMPIVGPDPDTMTDLTDHEKGALASCLPRSGFCVLNADCPWTPEHRLVRFGIKGQEIQRDERPTSNLVFLLDVSGSMSSVSGSTSQNTGVPPMYSAQLAVAENVRGGTTTSSPGCRSMPNMAA